MNPVHILAISLLALVAWGLGFITGRDEGLGFFPNGPSVFFVLSAATAVLASLARVIYLSLP